MALRLSTGMRDALLEKKAVASVIKAAATTIAFVSGGGPNGGDQITDSGNGLASAIRKGKVTVFGSGSNNNSFDILSSAAGYIEVPNGALTPEIAGASVTLVQASGGSVSDLFRNGVMRIFPGTQPVSADNDEGTTHICEISLASGAFTPGAPANGINFEDAVAGALGKDASEVWSGLGVNGGGQAGWFRMYTNNRTTGASGTAIRFDGAISTSNAQLNMSNTTITNGGTTTIDSGALSIPTL